MTLNKEAEELTRLLQGKVVAEVKRNRGSEICIEFENQIRLFVDAKTGTLELSLTGTEAT